MNLADPPSTGRVGRMVARLRAAGDGGVCLSDAEFGDSYTARNAISSARKMGYRIVSAPCRAHGHRGRVARYWLVQEGGKAEVTVTREDERTSQQPGAPTPVGAPLDLFPEYSRALGHGR